MHMWEAAITSSLFLWPTLWAGANITMGPSTLSSAYCVTEEALPGPTPKGPGCFHVSQ